MRLFIACDLTQAQKHELEVIQHNLASYLSGTRWVKPQGLHLTISFLGDLEETLVGAIKIVVEEAVSTCDPFPLKLGGSGVFPTVAKAKVLWIGVKEGEESLKTIKNEIDKGLERLGIKTEKRSYKPHLTLGRIRYPLPEKLISRFLEETGAYSSSRSMVAKLVLYESRLTAYGAFYYPLAEVQL